MNNQQEQVRTTFIENKNKSEKTIEILFELIMILQVIFQQQHHNQQQQTVWLFGN